MTERGEVRIGILGAARIAFSILDRPGSDARRDVAGPPGSPEGLFGDEALHGPG